MGSITTLVLTDDFAESGQCWQSEQHGLMLWVAEGKVVNLTIFPRFERIDRLDKGGFGLRPRADSQKHWAECSGCR